MSDTARALRPTAAAPKAQSAASARSGGLLQRRCACGTGSTLFGGACPECSKKRRAPLQAKLRIGRADDALEREADQTAERVLRGERLPSALSRASASVQRDGPAPGTQPQEAPKDAPKVAPKAPAEAAPDASAADAGATATTATPTCDPKGFKRADYLKQPGTSTNDFGLTNLTASSATVPAVVTKPAKGGVTLEATAAALPVIPSVYTAADTFVEGVVHFGGGGGRYDCPSGTKPIKWTITPRGADKIREGELDHCADFQLAFDLSLKRYADAVNALAGKRTFANQAAAEKALKKAVGVHPNDWFDAFVCLSRKTLVRDKKGWHKPQPVKRNDRTDADCDVVKLWIMESSLPEVGQTKHPASEIIKDCGEAGAKAPGAGPAKVAMADPDDSVAEPGDEGEADETLMQRRAGSDDFHDDAPAPDLVQRVLDSPGQALDSQAQAFMESRFGRDFGHVRVHTDDQAARSALSVNALAYTVDHHVVFGSGAYDPNSNVGRSLLAHELAHVVQQTGSGRPMLSRRPAGRTDFRRDSGLVGAEDLLDPEFTEWLGSLTRPELRDYQTIVADEALRRYIDHLLAPSAVAGVESNWFIYTKANAEAAQSASYWEQRLWRVVKVKYQPARLKQSAEERDAVYAALWSVLPPLPLAGGSVTQIVVPATAKRPNALLYSFSFMPRATPAAKDEVAIDFLAERTGQIAKTAAEPPKGFKEPALSYSSDIGFPRGADAYWRQYPKERAQIAAAVAQEQGAFDLTLVTHSPSGTGGREHEATIQVKGYRDPSGVLSPLDIHLLTEGRLLQAGLPRDYNQRDYGDLVIGDAQTNLSKKGDKLGHVDLRGVPANEMVPVKEVIAGYFTTMGSRNVEIDAIVPVPQTQQRVLYKLFFRNDNEVDVSRIGVEGETASLDPNALDVARVEGFDAHSKTATDLKTWLGKRYQALRPDGSTVPEVQASANQALQAGAGTAGWFEKQYKIFPLGASNLATRLKATHRLTSRAAAGTEDFQADELKNVERGLQTIDDALLKQLTQLRLGRQQKKLKSDGTPDEETLPDGSKSGYGGATFQTGNAITIVWYDGMLRVGEQYNFRGDAQRASRADTHIVLHELGHAIDDRTGARAAFNAFVKKEGIAPFTAYAQRHPTAEFFEDAFDMFQSNPSFLAQAHPRLHQWFTVFTTTGKVPAKLP